MKKNLFKILSVLLVIAGVLYWQTANSAPPKLDAGAGAPDFSLSDTEGNTIKLSDYKGKTVVLEWTNPDCPFVKRHYEAGTMKGLAESNSDVVWLTINSTHYFNKDKNTKWKSEKELPYAVLDDNPGTVGHAFDARTTPHMFIIDKEGAIKYQGAIDDDRFGSKEDKYRTNYVAAALADLKAGKEVSIPSTKPYGCSVKYAS